MANYFPYHVHTDLSNCTTNIDSVTKFHQYVEHAKELGMKALAFTEHGNIFEWYHKKLAVEEAGMKYVHGVEAYLTMHEQEKFKDNYHIVLLARNKEGFMEINRLVSSSFNRNDDIHYYYTPRILMSELERTSQNILITTACLGGPLNADSDEDRERFTRFMLKNKERCFLEIQHHLVAEQMMYNQSLLELSVRYGIPLIAGTDTHALTEAHLRGRKKLQEGKGIHFPQEENWSLQFMTYDELCVQYKTQNAIPEKYWREALENTNRLADMCEAFEVDSSIKYPNVIDDPVEALRNVVYEYAENHPHAIKRHGKEALYERLDMELDAFKQTGQSGYMYLLNHLCKWERENGERIGYGRGSVAGSMAAYVMGATHMDSMLHNLNFSRFCNVSRVSLADVDIDHSETDRDKTKRFLLDDHMGFDHLNTAEIVTFNTIATKGAIRDIARSFSMPLSEVSEICNSVDRDDKVPENIRTKYAELFEYVDIVSGTVVSYGSHPCGVLVSDHDIESEIGLCSSSGSNYRISCLNMKELDALNYVKWDVLGLDGIDLINTCCDLAGIERITPDNIDLEDMDVWKSIRDNNTCIFQFESDQAGSYLRRLMSDANIERMKKADPTFSMLKLFTFASALLRPACASFRDDVAEGKTYDNGCAEINDMLAGERGYVAYQERIMQFLSRFAGYSDSESDTVRRCISEGTPIMMADGSRKPIENVVVGDEVVAFDNGAAVSKRVTNAFDNGIADTVLVKCECGYSLRLTPDHKVLTASGWKPVCELKPGDCIFTPTKLPKTTDGLRPNQRMCCSDLFMLGLLIGDGTIGSSDLCFTNSDSQLVDAFMDCVQKHFRSTRVAFMVTTTPGKTVDTIYSVRIANPHRKYLRNFICDLGLNAKSADKAVPQKIMTYPANKKLLSFLGGLFSTDGGVDNSAPWIDYSTISETIAHQIKNLLLKFGIYSYVERSWVRDYGYYSYRVVIRSGESLEAFANTILPYVIGVKHDQYVSVISRRHNDDMTFCLPYECTQEIVDAAKVKGEGRFVENGSFLRKAYRMSKGKAQMFVREYYAPITYSILMADYRPVRIKSIEAVECCRVYDLEVEDVHNYVADGVIVHNCIAKKKGTETLLPEIERRFMDYAPKHLSISEEQAAIVIKDFLQVILDASSYGFSENHSMPYAITGYAIGYLRHYYPVHFVAAALNVYASNSEKIAAIMEYAQEHGIRVSPPRFGLSKAHTNIDTENLAIYKGLYSVKYMNEEVPNQLYEIAQTIGKNSTFMDLLTRIKAETSCDSRQLDILIKLDFFSAYGNSTELIAMNWYHDLLDGGKKRSIKKEKIFMTPLPDFIADYGTDCGRNGRELKQWNITDCPGLLRRCYRFVKDSNMREPTYEQKCKWQQEFLGYVDLTTGKIEDRKKLFITDMRPLRAKKDNSVWAYAVFTRSVGTGKCGRFTLRNWNYQLNPIKKEDIIQVLDYHNERGYWYLDEYEIVV